MRQEVFKPANRKETSRRGGLILLREAFTVYFAYGSPPTFMSLFLILLPLNKIFCFGAGQLERTNSNNNGRVRNQYNSL